jgi:mono/diheme cytochrome c family protein
MSKAACQSGVSCFFDLIASGAAFLDASRSGSRKLNRISRRLAPIAIFVALIVPATQANAADAESGERIAQSRCAACHVVVAPNQQRIVADAPPFEAIARKFDFNADALVFRLLEPHPKMNFALTRREANDVAAYMATLAR